MLLIYSFIGCSLPCTIKFLTTGRTLPLCSNILQLFCFYWRCALCFVHILLADIDIFFIFFRDSSVKSATYGIYLIKRTCWFAKWDSGCNWKKKDKTKIVNLTVYVHIVQGCNILAVAVPTFKGIQKYNADCKIVSWPSLTNCCGLRAQTFTAWPALRNNLSNATNAAVISLLDSAIAEFLQLLCLV